MAAPIPVEFFVQTPPADEPGNVQELLNLVAHSLGTEFSPAANLITGVMGGPVPTQNQGPWDNNGQWWFWNPSAGAYQRGSDGVPIGIVTIWGGEGNPPNWLICDGSEVSRTTYAGLFQAVGTTWGGGDGITTFNLPPGACFYLADGGFKPAPYVPLTDAPSNNFSNPNKGFGSQGGAQVVPWLTPFNLPALKVTIPWTNTPRAPEAASQQSGTASYLYPSSQSGAQACIFQIQDANGTPLNQQAQTQFACMPPFAAANFIIKYQ